MKKLDQQKLNQEELDLVKVLSETTDPKLMKLLLDDLLTEKELEETSQRLKAAVMLFEGKTYQDIQKETTLSTRTISRVRKCQQLFDSGYRTAYKILKK